MPLNHRRSMARWRYVRVLRTWMALRRAVVQYRPHDFLRDCWLALAPYDAMSLDSLRRVLKRDFTALSNLVRKHVLWSSRVPLTVAWNLFDEVLDFPPSRRRLMQLKAVLQITRRNVTPLPRWLTVADLSSTSSSPPPEPSPSPATPCSADLDRSFMDAR